MTCIVGLVDNGRIIMGGDSATTQGWVSTITAKPKVFKRGDMLIGGTGTIRLLQLVQYSFKIPEVPDGIDIHEYFVTHFCNALRECLKSGGLSETHDSNRERYSGELIVGYRESLITIDSAYGVMFSQDTYQSIGCGEEFALGSLATSDEFNLTPQKRVRLALEAAAKYSTGVSAPFHIETMESVACATEEV